MRIGIDLMGGDVPPRLLFPAVVAAAQRLGTSFGFVVFATPPVADDLSAYLSKHPLSNEASPIEFHLSEEVIGMDEDPLFAIRRKTRSTLVNGIGLLKVGGIDAFVSCGNTGALMAEATLSLPHLEGVARPGLLATLPTEGGTVAILDVGGNVASKAELLIRYAYLGSVYARVANGTAMPRVALLNIGTEAGKGTEEVRQAYRQLEALERDRANDGKVPFRFCGNIEGREIFRGICDVIVTDGFSGNIMLKTAEGVSSYIFDSLKEISSISAGAAGEAFEKLQKRFDYMQHLGAFICGIDALVFKVHGNADAASLLVTLLGAADCLSNNLIEKLKSERT